MVYLSDSRARSHSSKQLPKELLQVLMTPKSIGKFMKHLEEIEGKGETSTNSPPRSSFNLNFSQIFSPSFMKLLMGTNRLAKDDRNKVIRDVGDEMIALSTKRITEKQCRDVAAALVKKFEHSLKPAPHSNGVIGVGNQLYYHCNYKHRKSKKLNNNDAAAKSRRLFTNRECYGIDPELDLPQDFPEGETADTMEEKRIVLVNMFASGVLNKSKMKELMTITYAAQRADVNDKPHISDFMNRWPYFGRYSVLEPHFFKLMKKKKDEFDKHLTDYLPKLAKYFEAEGNKKRKGEAAKVSASIRSVMAKYLQIKEKTESQTIIAVVRSALLKLEVPSSALFFHLEETTSVDEIEASNKLPKDNIPIVVVLGNADDLLLDETHCYVVVEGKCIGGALRPSKALFQSFMCYFIFKICYRSQSAPIMDFIQRALFEIEEEAEQQGNATCNRVERRRTSKGYATAPKTLNRKYSSLMKEVADFLDMWGM